MIQVQPRLDVADNSEQRQETKFLVAQRDIPQMDKNSSERKCPKEE